MTDQPLDARTRMITAALDLFHTKGVNATGLSEVLKTSDTGKGQFTHYFKNKDGLIRAVLEFLFASVRTGQVESTYEIETWEDLERWFDTYIAYQESVDYERSCPMGTIGNDLSNRQEVIRQDIRLFCEWSRNKFSRFFAERRAAGELADSADPEGLADLCLCVMQGGMLLTKIQRSPDQFKNAADQVLRYIFSLRIPNAAVN